MTMTSWVGRYGTISCSCLSQAAITIFKTLSHPWGLHSVTYNELAVFGRWERVKAKNLDLDGSVGVAWQGTGVRGSAPRDI